MHSIGRFIKNQEQFICTSEGECTMAQLVNMDKLMQVQRLNKGDRVLLNDGQIADFVRLKKKNFDGLINGICYNIPVNMFIEVVEKVDVKEEENLLKQEYLSLNKDELFYINKKSDAILFKFDTIRDGKIIGINPITKNVTRIDTSFYGGKVENL